jgi:hypothetical protein
VERKTEVVKKISNRLIILFCVFWLTSACNQTPLSEEEFNATAWKNDQNGCLGERVKLADDLEKSREKIMGMSENQIRRLLGSPDKVQLFERSQKFYIYFIEKGSQCGKEGAEGKNYQVSEISLALPVNN